MRKEMRFTILLLVLAIIACYYVSGWVQDVAPTRISVSVDQGSNVVSLNSQD